MVKILFSPDVVFGNEFKLLGRSMKGKQALSLQALCLFFGKWMTLLSKVVSLSQELIFKS